MSEPSTAAMRVAEALMAYKPPDTIDSDSPFDDGSIRQAWAALIDDEFQPLVEALKAIAELERGSRGAYGKFATAQAIALRAIAKAEGR